jgi:hypothetical protein
MAANHGLRTTGRPTGNFGRPKQKGKPGELDLTKEILNRENLRIPQRDEAFTRLVTAYNTTTDEKLRAALWDMLKKRKATLQPVKVKPCVVSDRTHWDLIKLTR